MLPQFYRRVPGEPINKGIPTEPQAVTAGEYVQLVEVPNDEKWRLILLEVFQVTGTMTFSELVIESGTGAVTYKLQTAASAMRMLSTDKDIDLAPGDRIKAYVVCTVIGTRRTRIRHERWKVTSS